MDKEILERIVNLLYAVAHVGVHFDHGEFQLGNDEIEEARKLYSLLTDKDEEIKS